MAKKKGVPVNQHPDAATPEEVEKALKEVGVKLKPGEVQPPEGKDEDPIVGTVPPGLDPGVIESLQGIADVLKKAAKQAVLDHKRIPAAHANQAADCIGKFIKSCERYNPIVE